MAHVSLTWIAEQRYVGVDSTNHSVVISRPDDIGAKPSDLLLISLAACASFDVVEIVQKRRATLHRLAVEVDAEQASAAPWAYQRIHLAFRAVAERITQEQFEHAADLSLNKYCSVRASLHPDVQVTFSVELVSEL